MPWTHRENRAAAAIVDFGVCLEMRAGAALAWAYLARSGIPDLITCRVLGEPARRRAVVHADERADELLGSLACYLARPGPRDT